MVIVYFVIGVISIISSMLFSNLWEDITTSSVLGDSLGNFVFANNIMLNLPVYIAIIWVIGLVVTFAKPIKKEGGFQL